MAHPCSVFNLKHHIYNVYNVKSILSDKVLRLIEDYPYHSHENIEVRSSELNKNYKDVDGECGDGLGVIGQANDNEDFDNCNDNDG